jgi:methyl-accepting chemotaxis protein
MIIAFVLITFILLFVNKLIGPYIRVFDSIKHVMKKAKEGDYSQRVKEESNPQSKEVAISINSFLTKLETTLFNIESKIEEFLTIVKKDQKQDPLVGVENTVTRLADIYRFRKTIEHDETLDDVYDRLSNVLKD